MPRVCAAPPSSGISLLDGDAPLDGDITTMIGLQDAGTEVDETPGEGPNQAPRQTGPNAGERQEGPITAIDGYDGTINISFTVGEGGPSHRNDLQTAHP